MTMEIDLEDLDSLDEEQLRWARDRGLLTVEQEQQYLGDDLADLMGEAASADLRPGGPAMQAPGFPTTASDLDYTRMSKTELQRQAELRGLSKTGRPGEILKRIQEHDAGLEGGGDGGDEE